MSDPFSVAAGAVGVISLGIQSIGLKAESLKTPLKRLRDLVEDTRLSDPEIANDIHEKALGLELHVKRLEKKLEAIRPEFSDKTADKFRNKLKKAVYPVVSRDALRGIQSDLDSMQSTIQISLTIFNAEQAQKSQATQEKMVQMIEQMHLTVLSFSSKSVPAPGLLRSLCDRCDEDAQPATSQSWSISLNYRKRRSPAKFLERSYQYHSNWLHRIIKFSFSLSTGAGGFSIAPALHLCPVMSSDSWAGDKLLTIRRMDSPFVPEFGGSVEDFIRDFQDAFSAGELAPSVLLDDRGTSLSLVDGFAPSANWENTAMCMFVQFLIDCGSVPDNNVATGFLDRFCALQDWGAEELAFALDHINAGGPLRIMPWTSTGKRNMRGLLNRDEELIDLPEIGRALFENQRQIFE